ncbi:sigma 54-interacting transcriptional regulator [Sporolituus thermophilus]|uniref:PAS domain S-box-containing protein n=1 Tax=Sporolituus thermophilus DSM 23256 TaxID=1123285 RepID=A0A1G7HHF9_9FIRM|nr:sigma 54-interacting transcriptional regulator [Sporolituus thermophilus]SDE99947.1 PAS domain S-box-containing protein [Sporolituus thermophilus DSM 23256]
MEKAKQPGNGRQAVTLALISTYEDMAEIFIRITEQEGLPAHVAIAALDRAAAVARELAPQVDVVLSRGGTAEYIREAVDIPVVAIPITPFDVVRSVFQAKELGGRELALFNYGSRLYGVSDMEAMLGVKIHEYTFLSEAEMEEGIKDAKARGIPVAVGGIVTVELAAKHGLKSVLIRCGEEAVYRSVCEAVHVAEVRRLERGRTARFQAVLDSITEGIIVTDETNRITIFNPAAARIFRMNAGAAIGKPVQEVIPNTRMHKVLESGKPELGVLQEINGGIIATNRVPIWLDGRPIGVVSTFEDVTKIQHLEQKIREKIHAKGFVARHKFEDIVTANEAMQELIELARLYAGTDSAVLIQGESGTGKEVFAQSIHNASRRASGPFVAVNCAAIPEHLLESELFGYEGGAFTGARKEGKPGLFELAHGGTIFLDEIGEIAPSLQARLLRVLQEKEIMRVGGDKIIPIDIRIISATNKDLKRRVEQGEFREDLYYRLNVLKISLPPLRERPEDILPLAMYFLQKQLGSGVDYEQAAQELAPLLRAYNWRGNIRELSNFMERLAVLAAHFPAPAWRAMLQKVSNTPLTEDDSITVRVNLSGSLKEAVSQVEKKIIETLLEKSGKDYEQVAKRLGIGRTTLWRKQGGTEFPKMKK